MINELNYSEDCPNCHGDGISYGSHRNLDVKCECCNGNGKIYPPKPGESVEQMLMRHLDFAKDCIAKANQQSMGCFL